MKRTKRARRGGRHKLGVPPPGLEWIMVAQPGSGGRHRASYGPGGGAIAAGILVLATSAASPAPVPAGPSGTIAGPGPAGAAPVPVEQQYTWEAEGTAPAPRPEDPVDLGAATAVGGRVPMIPVVYTGDIPSTMLDAYRRARDAINLTQPGCRLPVELLAAIGKVESGHARGGQVDQHGNTVRPILGPALDGNGFAAIPDTDGGALDGDTTWDRAVGPMQFIPGTWRRWASDGNGDGRATPHNVYDAGLAAARYLCAANRDLGTPQGLDQAILSYNHSISYRNLVLGWMATYAKGTVVVPDGTVPALQMIPPAAPVPTPTTTTPVPTTTAPPTTAPPTVVTPTVPTTTTPLPTTTTPLPTTTTTTTTTTTSAPPSEPASGEPPADDRPPGLVGLLTGVLGL